MKKPNIILITSHDLGRHLGCYGIEEVSTPNIDNLAKEGVLFENAFCTAPQCSPSRSSIYTGRYPHANGVMGLTHANFAWDLYENEQHLAGRLKSLDYQTALCGVQHETQTQRVSDMGFDERLITNSHEGYDAAYDVCSRAKKYIETRSPDRPFYLQVGLFEPHRPFDFGGAQSYDKNGVFIPDYIVNEPSAREEFAEFQGAIKQLDDGLGKLFDAISESDFADNTMVIFTVDHGIPFPRSKCSLIDAGLEVALIIKYPDANWVGGKRFNDLVSLIDIFPTLQDLVEFDSQNEIHGKSLLPILNDNGSKVREYIYGEMTYHDYYDPRRCIRNERYKLIANFSTAPEFMNPSQNYRPKTITAYPIQPEFSYHEYFEFYDLKMDPSETKNLINDEALKDLIDIFGIELLKWMQETNDPLLKGAVTAPQHLAVIESLSA